MGVLNSLQRLGKRLSNMRRDTGKRAIGSVDVYAEAVRDVEALRLIGLGARASQVCQLTSIPKAMAKRLYRQVNGHASPPGQAPFTDTWYVQSDQRMLHANIVWRLSQKLRALDRNRAQMLINLYESYLCDVPEPLLDLAHVEFVPHLLSMKLWRERVCKVCGTEYVGPITDVEIVCPACRIRRLYRCARCDSLLQPQATGRRAKLCGECRREDARRQCD